MEGDARYYRWGELERQQPTPQISRRFVVGEKAMLALIELKEGAVVPPHSHPEEQFSYVLSGSVKFQVNKREFIVSAGEVLHIPAGVEHSATALVDCTALDIYSPPRQDLISGLFDKRLKIR